MFIESSKADISPEISFPTPSLAGEFRLVAASDFHAGILDFCSQRPSDKNDITLLENYDHAECWVMNGGLSGFAVTPCRELTNVFSRISGQGARAVKFAQENYDFLHLNCFEGNLESFYARHGFEVLKREPNWYHDMHTKLPGVVYMAWEKK